MAFFYQQHSLVLFLIAAFYIKSSRSFSIQENHHPSQIKFEQAEQGVSRRSMLLDSIALISAATAAPIISNKSGSLNNDSICSLSSSCLDLHLPPKPAKTIRLYLCRHGQTENNRLHKLQGGNVDPPLNDNGILMAKRLGMTLRKNIQNKHTNLMDHERDGPILIYHSTMLRAQQTAEIAADQFSNKNTGKRESSLLHTIGLDSLVELDYSSSPSFFRKDFNNIPSRQNVQQVYNRWMEGHIDEKLGKESARDILNRCASSLNTMVEGAKEEESSSVVAVAHGSYLRFMLAAALDLPLAKYVAGLHLDNASISVLDIEKDAEPIKRNVSNSNLFVEGSKSRLSRKYDDFFSMSIPKSTAIRVNEIRHLAGVPRS